MALPPMRSIKGVRLLGSEERDGIVAPVVLEFLSCDWIELLQLIFVKLKNWHQLNGGHSQVLEIRDFFDQPGESSRMRHTRTGMDCETANVCLVDDCVRGGMLWRESVSQSKWSQVKMDFGAVPALSTVEKLKSDSLLEES